MEAKKRCAVRYVTRETPFGERLAFSKPKDIYSASTSLAKKHNVRGSSLDVGPGENKAVSRSLNNMGVAAHTIDLHGDLYSEDQVVLSNKITSGRGKDFEGNVLFIHGDKSALKGKKFDWITFWASWGGFEGLRGNFTFDMISESLKSKKRWFDYVPSVFLPKKWKRVKETLKKDLQDTKNLGLMVCKKALAAGGKIAIVSTRYVRGGGSTRLKQIPLELKEHKSLIDRFKKLGAKKIHVYAKPWGWVDAEIAKLAGEFKGVLRGKEGKKKLAAQHLKRYANNKLTETDLTKRLHDRMINLEEFDDMIPYLENAQLISHITALRKKEQVPIIDAIVAEF